MVAQIRVTDAAGIAARLAARGDDAGAQAAVVALAPAGASLELSGSARITARVAAPPMAAILPGVRVSAQAVAAAEPPMVVP